MTFLLQKMADEGSSEPFYARLWMTVFGWRDQNILRQYPLKDIEKHRAIFDKVYGPVLEAAGSCRKAGKAIVGSMATYRSKLENRDGVREQRHAIEIPDSIENDLAENARKLLTDGVIATKSTQDVTRYFGIDIAFMFARQANYENGLRSLQSAGHPELAKFLSLTRQNWSEAFIKLRGDLEHNGWILPKMQYNVTNSGAIELIEPSIEGSPISAYSERMFNRVLSFVENVTIYGFQHAFRNSHLIVEIPREQRDLSKPERFKLLFKGSNETEWNITYSETDFP